MSVCVCSCTQVAALSEALLGAGIDPEPITAQVEASYLGVDAAAGSEGDDALITVSPGAGDQLTGSPGPGELDDDQQGHRLTDGKAARGSEGGFVYSAPTAIPFANGVEAAEQWSLGQEEDVLC